jgi:hypothetical protein
VLDARDRIDGLLDALGDLALDGFRGSAGELGRDLRN